ncbi:MAG: response regulator [Oscillospiraceae bacterium]|nr:response regulator [Oscillospiraceae bacterium]
MIIDEDNFEDVSVLLVEDDKIESDIFKEYFLTKDKAMLIAVTNSSDEALNYVKTHSPDGVILDMELHYGVGSGYKFLKELQMLKIDDKPVVVVTTKLDSEIAYDFIYSYNVPSIFYKNKQDYSPEFVVNTLIELVNTKRKLRKSYIENIDTEEVKRKRIQNRITKELDIIGIGDNLRGKRYLFDAIYYLIENGIQNVEYPAVKMLESKYKKSHANVIKVMQTAIYHAWRKSTIETLEEQYTAVVYHNTGVPTVNEFIYYYAIKVNEFFK